MRLYYSALALALACCQLSPDPLYDTSAKVRDSPHLTLVLENAQGPGVLELEQVLICLSTLYGDPDPDLELVVTSDPGTFRAYYDGPGDPVESAGAYTQRRSSTLTPRRDLILVYTPNAADWTWEATLTHELAHVENVGDDWHTDPIWGEIGEYTKVCEMGLGVIVP